MHNTLLPAIFLDCSNLEDGNDSLFPKIAVTNYQATLHNMAEEQRSLLHRGGKMKSLKKIATHWSDFLIARTKLGICQKVLYSFVIGRSRYQGSSWRRYV